jgi:hypothetical protein
MEPLIECNPDVMILSSAIFKDPEGATEGLRKCRAALDSASLKFNLK